MKFEHVSVLLNECIESLKISPNKIYIDGTMGGAGHSKEIRNIGEEIWNLNTFLCF